jgi:hypothetical protein
MLRRGCDLSLIDQHAFDGAYTEVGTRMFAEIWRAAENAPCVGSCCPTRRVRCISLGVIARDDAGSLPIEDLGFISRVMFAFGGKADIRLGSPNF